MTLSGFKDCVLGTRVRCDSLCLRIHHTGAFGYGIPGDNTTTKFVVVTIYTVVDLIFYLHYYFSRTLKHHLAFHLSQNILSPEFFHHG